MKMQKSSAKKAPFHLVLHPYPPKLLAYLLESKERGCLQRCNNLPQNDRCKLCLQNGLTVCKFFLPVDGDGQEVQDGGGAAEDVAHGPHLAQLSAERPLRADLREQEQEVLQSGSHRMSFSVCVRVQGRVCSYDCGMVTVDSAYTVGSRSNHEFCRHQITNLRPLKQQTSRFQQSFITYFGSMMASLDSITHDSLDRL